MNKAIVSLTAGATTLATALAPYVISTGDGSQAEALGGVATDFADSIISNITAILPVMLPVIVVGFIVGFIRSMLLKR